MQNRINAVFTDEQLTAVKNATKALDTNLPFLVDLKPEEKRTLTKFGDKSVAFVNKCNELVQQTSDFLPRKFDIDAMKTDVELYNRLYSIIQPLRMLMDKLEDTLQLAGSEAYAAALFVYQQAKLNRGEIPGVEAVLDELGKRFIQKSTEVEEKQTT